MSSTLKGLREKCDWYIQDTDRTLDQRMKDTLIHDAVKIFSKDKPQTKVKDITGDGTNYDYNLPTDWVDNFSNITSRIEYQAGEHQNPSYIDDNSWVIYKNQTTTKLRILTFTPASSYIMRFTYSLPHSETTIDGQDEDAVAKLAASLCCRALAAYYSQTTDSTIDADAIDYARKTDDYTNLANVLEMQYNKHLGKGSEEDVAKPGASAVKDLDMNFAWGRQYLTHPSTWR